MIAAASDRAGTRHVGANRPADAAAASAPSTIPTSITDVTSTMTGAFNEAACAGAAQYGHDATCTPAADAAFAPHSANAPVTPHGRPDTIKVAMLTSARPIAPATSGHGPCTIRRQPECSLACKARAPLSEARAPS